MTHPTALGHLRWPVEQFYWAILDASVVFGGKQWGTRRGADRLHQRLGYLFENLIPGEPIENVHAVYLLAPGETSKYLACGLPRAAIEAETASSALLTLVPDDVPPFVRELDVDRDWTAELNLLCGRYTPAPVRRMQRRWVLQVAVILLILAGLAVVGLDRRVHALRSQSNTIESQKLQVLEQVLGPTKGGRPNAVTRQPASLRMLAELRQLEQTRAPLASSTNNDNCTSVLAELITHWPSQLHVQTESIVVAPTNVTIRAQVPKMNDAQTLANSFLTLDGWQVSQPQSEARRDQVDVTVRLQRKDRKDVPS